MIRPLPVVWKSWHAKAPGRGYWDQTIIEELLAGKYGAPAGWPVFRHVTDTGRIDDRDGCLLVVPGAAAAPRWAEVADFAAARPWCLLILTSDEAGTFPVADLLDRAPHVRVWQQYPRHSTPAGVWPVPVGPTPHEALTATPWSEEPQRDYWFAGQDSNPRRHAAITAMRALPHRGEAVATTGFAQGTEPWQYVRRLASARIAPAPGGIVSADSFRLWEALTVGAVPIVDPISGEHGDTGTWQRLTDAYGVPPFPVVADWTDDLAGAVDDVLADWPAAAEAAAGWLLRVRRMLASRLVSDLFTVGAPLPTGRARDDLVVLVPTSPIPSNPDLAIIETTLGSIRHALGDAQVVVMADGVRDAQREQYEAVWQATIRRMQERIAHGTGPWKGVELVAFPEHQHQARMTRTILGRRSEPVLLFVEHDTPLVGHFPWHEAVTVVRRGDLHYLRLHYDDTIHPEHEPLMLGTGTVGFVPVRRTQQWSQRPHLANRGWYLDTVLAPNFPDEQRCMIEDVMHGVVQDAHSRNSDKAWDTYRMAIYEPHGSIKRSTHLDGRAGDPKWEFG